MTGYGTKSPLAWGTSDEKPAGLSAAMLYLEYDATARWAVIDAREHGNGRFLDTANRIGQSRTVSAASRG